MNNFLDPSQRGPRVHDSLREVDSILRGQPIGDPDGLDCNQAASFTIERFGETLKGLAKLVRGCKTTGKDHKKKVLKHLAPYVVELCETWTARNRESGFHHTFGKIKPKGYDSRTVLEASEAYVNSVMNQFISAARERRRTEFNPMPFLREFANKGNIPEEDRPAFYREAIRQTTCEIAAIYHGGENYTVLVVPKKYDACRR